MAHASRWLPFCLVAALILLFSTDFFSGGSVYMAVQTQVIEKVVTVDDGFYYFEEFLFQKGSHALCFVMLAVAAFPLRKKPLGAQLALSLCGLVALGSEMLQALSQTRKPAVLDVGIDLAAAIIGLNLLFHPPAPLARAGAWLVERTAPPLAGSGSRVSRSEQERVAAAARNS